MKKVKFLLPLAIASVAATGCKSSYGMFMDALNGAVNDATKPVSERIAVDDATKADVKARTHQICENQYSISSASPYDNEPGTVDISSAEDVVKYYDLYRQGVNRYRLYWGKDPKTGYGLYKEEGGKRLDYQTEDSSHTYTIIDNNNGSYTTKMDGSSVMMDKEAAKHMMKLWGANFRYCYSWELNNIMGLSAQLNNEEIHDTDIDFLSNTTFKDYTNAGNYTAYYRGVASSVEDPHIRVDYMEISYVDYRLSYMLTHGVNTQTNRHTLFVSDYSY